MQLDALLAAAGLPRVPGAIGTDITAIVHDTAGVTPGALFCCVTGSRVDGHTLAPRVVAAGAAALLVERRLGVGVPEVQVPSVREAMGPLAAAFWQHPARDLHLVGVTGTSGKTTSIHMLAAIFEAHGWTTGLIGTLSGARTTPEAPELQALLAAERDAGRRAVAMEVSSHALSMGRVRGTHFEVGMFTNLSRDHLDFHRDLDEYFAAKSQLFTPAYVDAAVVNLDDPRGVTLADAPQVPTEGYRLADAAELESGASWSRFSWRGSRVELPLGGRFNVSNALGAATAAARLGVEPGTIATGLNQVAPVPGRWEVIEEGQPFTVIVDYSHKPDALDHALRAARQAAAPEGRVIAVFGAGGDRDATKRPEMGAVAAERADHVVLTSDNPRSEDPLVIIGAILSGMGDTSRVTIEADRGAAIAAAVGLAAPGDVVLVAGKGHETYQVIGDQTVDFDDRAVARQAIADRQAAEAW